MLPKKTKAVLIDALDIVSVKAAQLQKANTALEKTVFAQETIIDEQLSEIKDLNAEIEELRSNRVFDYSVGDVHLHHEPLVATPVDESRPTCAPERSEPIEVRWAVAAYAKALRELAEATPVDDGVDVMFVGAQQAYAVLLDEWADIPERRIPEEWQLEVS